MHIPLRTGVLGRLTVLLLLFSGWIASSAVAQNASVQVIHNSPDPAASTVDIYLDDGTNITKLEDVDFRTATAFLDIPAGTYDVVIAGPTSTGIGDQVVFTESGVNVVASETYAVIATGVVTPGDFETNPDGTSTAFQLLIETGVRTTPNTAGNAEFFIVHGSPDAPTVDALARGVAPLADDASYTDITSYVSVPAADYTVDVTPGDRSDVVASFTAPLGALGGGSAVVLASGFLDPSVNQGGPAFGLIAVLADGTVLTLPATTFPLLINEIDADTPTNPTNDSEEFVELYNTSDEASIVLDPYVLVLFNGNGDSSYRTEDLGGTSIPPNGFYLIGSSALSPDVTLPNNTIQNGADAVGLYRADASAFPDGTSPTTTGLEDAFVYGTGDAEDTALLAALGETIQYDEDENGNDDTESIQRFPDGSETIVITTPTPSIQNLPVELGAFTVSLSGADVILNWTTLSESGNARFEIQQRASSEVDSAPFRTVGSVEGQGTTADATDYRFRVSDLAPGTYQFRLRQVDVDGSESFSGMRTATIGMTEAFALSPMAPHPVQAKSSSMLQVQRAGVVTVELYDLLGRRVQVLHDGPMRPSTPLALTVDAEQLPSGVYFLRARGDGFQTTQRISVVR